ncbi:MULTISPECIES: hypothetical protein [unclassified Pseudoclavibacter]|uniref:hypothetical protein n=1 Tax=unclassified Pseudoclavibacter TaxID=2615177 RepID=UPI0012F341FA|nr:MULTISPECIES: hypothetical protein [unclassified Pseudoclavibacter]MBF4457435.1 hypothetical protein [Pseudoclavibacter sp. VKM Ac-2867]VXC03223.1 conserved exported hypothetical protein [Pseudoclavibacter sp. 8L]
MSSDSTSRRTLLAGAAWSVPAVAITVAAPIAVASTPAPLANTWYTGGSTSVVSGNVARFTLTGDDGDGNDSVLPDNSTVVITPDAGVTIVNTAITGGVLTDNGDGSFTATVDSGVTTLVANFRVTGPSGANVSYVSTVALPPFTETFQIPIV